jgi:hypothetical protein
MSTQKLSARKIINPKWNANHRKWSSKLGFWVYDEPYHLYVTEAGQQFTADLGPDYDTEQQMHWVLRSINVHHSETYNFEVYQVPRFDLIPKDRNYFSTYIDQQRTLVKRYRG